MKEKEDCAGTLQLLAAWRGASNSLMADVMEDHIRDHIGGSRPSQEVTADVPAVVRNCVSEGQRLAAATREFRSWKGFRPKTTRGLDGPRGSWICGCSRCAAPVKAARLSRQRFLRMRVNPNPTPEPSVISTDRRQNIRPLVGEVSRLQGVALLWRCDLKSQYRLRDAVLILGCRKLDLRLGLPQLRLA